MIGTFHRPQPHQHREGADTGSLARCDRGGKDEPMVTWIGWPALGHRLKEGRLAAGMSQRELAHAVRVPQSTYSIYERGVQRPSRERLAMLAAVLSLDVDQLLVCARYEQPESAGGSAAEAMSTLGAPPLWGQTSEPPAVGSDDGAAPWQDFGERLRAARTHLQVSQRDVARAAGVSRADYWQYEEGRQRPRRDRVERLALVLQIDYAELLVLTGYMWPPLAAADVTEAVGG